MHGSLPNDPLGTSPHANWLRKLRRYLLESRLLPGLGYKLKRTSSGVILEIEGGRGGGGSQGVIQCRVTELFGEDGPADYIGVKRWDGTDESGNQFLAAKSPPSRMVATYTSGGIEYACDYTSGSDNDRIVTPTGGDPVDQAMWEEFAVGQVVYVALHDHTEVFDPDDETVELKYQEVRTAREWTEPEVVA